MSTRLGSDMYVWPRHIFAAGLGITPQMLRKVERAGVLKRAAAPAFKALRVKPFVREEVERVFGIGE